MTVRMNRFIVVFSLSFCVGAGMAQDQPTTAAQDQPPTSNKIALTVQPGVPIHVALEKSLPIKQAGVPVEGHVVEPVYVFDHLVIPAGSKVLGHVTQVDELTRKQRALTIANGDFTPYRKAHLDFDTLVLKDGKQLPLHTAVSQGVPNMVHLTAGEQGKKKKGRVSETVDQARQEVKTREQETVKEITAPDKMQRVKSALAAELPYHKQSLPAGTQFTAELKAPLELGTEDPPPKELEQLGGEIPPGSVVHVRLVTRLSSATGHRGSPVRAVVSEPLFSSDHHLILPEGTRLEGSVTQAIPARWLGRNGQLRFAFRQIDLPQGGFRRVEASLQGVEAAAGAHVELDSEGGLITTGDRHLAARCESYIWAGRKFDCPWYEHYRLGWNYRMTEFQGALLLQQLKRLEIQNAKRRANARYLNRHLSELPEIRLLEPPEYVTKHSHHLYILRFEEKDFGLFRPNFLEALQQEGISCLGDTFTRCSGTRCFSIRSFIPGGAP